MGREEIVRFYCDSCKEAVEVEEVVRFAMIDNDQEIGSWDVCRKCAADIEAAWNGTDPAVIISPDKIKKKPGRPAKKTGDKKVAKKVVKKKIAKRPKKAEASKTEDTAPDPDISDVVAEACEEVNIEPPKELTLREIMREAQAVDKGALKKSLQDVNRKYFEPVEHDGLIWDPTLGCWRQATDINRAAVKRNMKKKLDAHRRTLEDELGGKDNGDYGKMNVKLEG